MRIEITRGFLWWKCRVEDSGLVVTTRAESKRMLRIKTLVAIRRKVGPKRPTLADPAEIGAAWGRMVHLVRAVNEAFAE